MGKYSIKGDTQDERGLQEQRRDCTSKEENHRMKRESHRTKNGTTRPKRKSWDQRGNHGTKDGII